MRVIPVLDIRQSQVVRGVAGRRDEYKPLVSPLCPGSQVAELAKAFRQQFSFELAYLADLDALAGGEPSWNDYEAVLGAGLDLMVDAGITNLTDAQRLADFVSGERKIRHLVVALESLAEGVQLRELVQTVGSRRLVFSLDLVDGRPLTRRADWQTLTPLQLAQVALAAGARRLIVLDLRRVGINRGPGTIPLCRQLRRLDRDIEIIAGGGVRGNADLDLLHEAGCDAALVASALHDGRLTAETLARLVVG